MKPPVKNRAYWSKTFHCVSCKKPRPQVLAATIFETYNTETQFGRCIMCQRRMNRLKVQKSRKNESQAQKEARLEADRARKEEIPLSVRRCRDNYYKIRARTPRAIPFWTTPESLLPIYEYAELLNVEKSGYTHRVEHIIPLRADKNVCGLHTLKNLRIRRRSCQTDNP